MKYQIIAFLIAINYISCTVTLTKVNKGSCANSKYTFTLTGTTTEAITGSTSTVAVTLSSPASTTATCTIADATAPGSNPTPTPAETEEEEEEEATEPVNPGGRRRLAAGDVTITCSISTALDGATLTVSNVKVNNVDATIANLVQITDKVTCKASEGGDDGNEDDSGKFIQLSGLLLLFILFAF